MTNRTFGKKWICLILTFVILLSGMCFSSYQTASVLASIERENTVDSVTGNPAQTLETSSPSLCQNQGAEEVFGTRGLDTRLISERSHGESAHPSDASVILRFNQSVGAFHIFLYISHAVSRKRSGYFANHHPLYSSDGWGERLRIRSLKGENSPAVTNFD